MGNRRVLKIIIGILVIVLVAAAVIFLFPHKQKKQKEPEVKLEKLESDEKLIDFELIDETNSYNESQKAELVSEVQDVLDQFTGTIFTFQPDTKNYTKDLLKYFGDGEVFKYATKDIVKNIYPEFQGCHMESEFQAFKMSTLLIRKNKVNPEVSVIGYTKAAFGNDKVQNGDYYVTSQFVLIKMEDGWKIYSVGIDNVYKTEGFKVKRVAGTGDRVVKMEGSLAMTFNFLDVEGFLNDYKYTGNIDSVDETRDIDSEIEFSK